MAGLFEEADLVIASRRVRSPGDGAYDASVVTVIGDDGAVELDGRLAGDTLLVAAGDIPRLVGWELRPEGLCRGEVCVPLRATDVERDGGLVDLGAVAAALDRPVVLDVPADAAAIGAPASWHDERVGLRVSDFALPTVDGGELRWSSLGRKKKLLFAWASW